MIKRNSKSKDKKPVPYRRINIKVIVLICCQKQCRLEDNNFQVLKEKK